MIAGGPVALVTGASSGLGEAVARQLAVRGYSLLLASENEPELQRVRREIEAEPGVQVRVLVEDLAAPGAAERLWERCGQERRSVEVLVNCAGVFLNTDRELEDPDAVERLLALHVQSSTRLCLRFGREMIGRGKGYILNVASICAYFPDPSSLSYGPSKRYLLALSETLHLAWREHGVRVCCLVPGGIGTAFFARNGIYIPAFVARHLCSARTCARRALAALFRGRARVVVPPLRARLNILLFRLLLAPALYGFSRRLYFRLRADGLRAGGRGRGFQQPR